MEVWKRFLHCGSEEGCTEHVGVHQVLKIPTPWKHGEVPTPWKCGKGFIERNRSKDYPKVKAFERDLLGAS